MEGRLEVSPRTLRRDVERLRELGYDVQMLNPPELAERLRVTGRLLAAV